MDQKEIIQRYLTEDQQYIKKVSKETPLSKEDFFVVLKWWKIISKSDTIHDLGNKKSSNEAWIHIKIGHTLFYLNADTKRHGIVDFLKNKENPWLLITNEKGKKNKVTNTPNAQAISGLYLYKKD